MLSCQKDSISESYENIKRFTVSVELPNHETMTNWGILFFPDCYFSSNDSVRVIIYCHSGGGIVSSSYSEAENQDYIKYLVSEGYAVLSMQLIPENYAKSLKIDIGRTAGHPIAVQATQKGYDYVIGKYRIFTNGCFLLSNSHGGLTASNIVNLTNIPVIAQSGIAPLLSVERNAWFVKSGSMSNIYGEFENYQIRANIIRLYGMKEVHTQEELNNAVYEKNKVGKYDPFDYILNQTKQAYRTPFLIFNCKQDNVVYYSIAKTFADTLNQRGSEIVISDNEEYGGHNVLSNPIYIGNFVYIGTTYPIRSTYKEIISFFQIKFDVYVR